jgi:uncharacterized membrane protein
VKEWLTVATEYCATIIEIMALFIIVAGTIEAFVSAAWAMLTRTGGHQRRDIWLRQARWLVAGLTFQLAADVIETAVTTSWDAVGRIAAIAAIRTFLNFFLERDLREIRQRQRESNQPAAIDGPGLPR